MLRHCFGEFFEHFLSDFSLVLHQGLSQVRELQRLQQGRDNNANAGDGGGGAGRRGGRAERAAGRRAERAGGGGGPLSLFLAHCPKRQFRFCILTKKES